MFKDALFEDNIIIPYNLGPDCDTICNLLYDYGEKFIF